MCPLVGFKHDKATKKITKKTYWKVLKKNELIPSHLEFTHTLPIPEKALN